jgi:hypothetical protein
MQFPEQFRFSRKSPSEQLIARPLFNLSAASFDRHAADIDCCIDMPGTYRFYISSLKLPLWDDGENGQSTAFLRGRYYSANRRFKNISESEVLQVVGFWPSYI